MFKEILSKNNLPKSNINKNSNFLKSLRFVLILFIMSCIFDPSDQLLGLKVPLYLLVWTIFFVIIIFRGEHLIISYKLLLYLLLFSFIIPIYSIVYYIIVNGDLSSYNGFNFLKSYLFLTIVIVLYSTKIELIKPTIHIITILSALTILIFIIGLINKSFIYGIMVIGERYDLTRFGNRNFGGTNFPMVYFETSPLMVFSIGYFAKNISDLSGAKKFGNVLLLMLNVIAMFLGATRNNMFISILSPLFIFFWYSKKKLSVLLFSLIFISAIVGSNFDKVQGMLDDKEESNNVKLSYIPIYMKLFDEPEILFFGQGLGSFFHDGLGYHSDTELTYFEFVRRFGIIITFVILMLLFYPLTRLRSKEYYYEHYLFISYFFYLIMCFSNPLLISSTGMLLLSLVLFKSFSKSQPITGNYLNSN